MRMLTKYSLIAMTVAGLLSAQHGGGGGGGHHGGGGGGVSSGGTGFSGGAHVSRPASSGFSGINTPRVLYPTPVGEQRALSGFTGIVPGSYGNRLRPTGYPVTTTHPGRGGVGVGYPPNRRPGRTGYYAGYYPYLGYGFGDSWYSDSPTYVGAEPYEQYPAYGLQQDPNVEMGPAPYYPPIPYQSEVPPPQASVPEPPAAPAPPMVLVLKSGQKLEVQSYAIMNGELWDFTKPNSKRIRLADVDQAASAKATDEVGGSFPAESFAANRE